jgi:hypothetical protein
VIPHHSTPPRPPAPPAPTETALRNGHHAGELNEARLCASLLSTLSVEPANQERIASLTVVVEVRSYDVHRHPSTPKVMAEWELPPCGVSPRWLALTSTSFD